MTRSALIQDFFIAPGGSEQVAIELARLLPGSDVFTTFMDAEYGPRLDGHPVHTWPLQRMRGARLRYRAFLPLYPLWFERLDLRRFDLVVSSSSAFAKAVRTRRSARHIAYVHAPMRYAWDLESYIDRSSLSPASRLAARTLRPALRWWDRRTSVRPDVVVANSLAVRDRIRRVWDRDAEVIHPPVDLSDIEPSTRDEGFLLVVARLLAYRRIDVLVDAAAHVDRPVIVIGDGLELDRLRRRAGPSVRFLGRISRDAVVDHLRRCHAYVVPGEEDFGMAPVEAMAAGKPVIAYAAGGALETVIDGKTGLFFERQTPEALVDAVQRLDRLTLDPEAIRANAERFAPPLFRRRFIELFQRLGVDPSLYLSSPD